MGVPDKIWRGFRGVPLFPPYSRGEVLLQKIYHFGFMSRLGKRLELTIIKILISVSRQQHRASRPPSAAVF